MASMSPVSGTQPFVPQVGRSVSIDQAAQLLGVSRRTIYNRIKDGRLATLRTLGGSQRVLIASLERLAVPWRRRRRRCWRRPAAGGCRAICASRSTRGRRAPSA
jgi:excisionase family DNA binding protein